MVRRVRAEEEAVERETSGYAIAVRYREFEPAVHYAARPAALSRGAPRCKGEIMKLTGQKGAFPKIRFVRCCRTALVRLRHRDDVDAAIPLPAGFVALLADRAFFAVADQVELS